jgi:hypothetical protein
MDCELASSLIGALISVIGPWLLDNYYLGVKLFAFCTL